jgi:hypothetical protein
MQQIFAISLRRAKMAAMDIFKLPPSRVKPISVFRAMPPVQPMVRLKRASSATDSMCYRLPTWSVALFEFGYDESSSNTSRFMGQIRR